MSHLSNCRNSCNASPPSRRESAERRVQRLSGDYHHHVGNMEKTERDRIIAMIDQAHEIAYARHSTQQRTAKAENQTGRR